jgi:hypothetical protein
VKLNRGRQSAGLIAQRFSPWVIRGEVLSFVICLVGLTMPHPVGQVVFVIFGLVSAGITVRLSNILRTDSRLSVEQWMSYWYAYPVLVAWAFSGRPSLRS